MKFVVAAVSSTLMRGWRASLLASPTVLPASTVPWRWIAPVRARIASSSVVLPLWNGPTSATQRGPVALAPLPLPFVAGLVAMTASRNRLLKTDPSLPLLALPRGPGWEGSGAASFQAAAGPVERRNIAFVAGWVRRQKTCPRGGNADLLR